MRQRHPASFSAAASLLVVMCAVCVAPLCCRAASVQEEAKGYRLAGTLAVGSDYIALLQVPDGSQILLREGSMVGDAKVLAVTEQEITLRLGSGVVELSLAGTARPIQKAPTAAIVARADGPEAGVFTRKVDQEQLSRELAKSSPASATAQKSTSGIVAAQRITAVLDLPPSSRVLKVAEQPVKSADEAIDRLQKSLTSSTGTVTLDVMTPRGPARVYLSASRD